MRVSGAVSGSGSVRAALLTLLLFIASACGDDPATTTPASSCEAVLGDPVPAVFAPFGLGDSVLVSEVAEDATSTNARGLADAPLAQVYDAALAAARASGLQILSVEQEVIDAEILLSSPAGELLGLQLTRGACDRQTRVALSYLAG